METLTLFIAVGEICAGLFYTAGGVFFAASAINAEERSRTVIRVWLAVLFIVGGFEELADAVVLEGENDFAYWVQGVLTFLQFTTGGYSAYILGRVYVLQKGV